MKRFNNNQKIHALFNLFRKSYKKLAIGIVVITLITTGVIAVSKTVFKPNKIATNQQTSEKQSEVLGEKESIDQEEISKFPTPSVIIKNSTLSPTQTLTPTPTNTPTPTLQPTPNPTSIPTPTPHPIFIPQPTQVPTSIPTSTPQPSIYVNPEIEAKLAELRQTLADIENQPVPMSVIEGRKQRAYQDWVKNNPEIYSAILGSRYINDLNAILTAYGL